MARYSFLIAFLMTFLGYGLTAQVRPDHFVEETSPNNSNFETYSQKGGVNRRASMANLRKYFGAEIVNGSTPALSGNGESLRNKIILVLPDSVTYFVDYLGDAVKLGGGGIDSLSMVQDSIVVLYADGNEIARDTINFPPGYTAWLLAGDTGTPSTIGDGATATVAGGTGLSSVVSGSTVTVNLDNTAITPGTFGSATQVVQITYDAQGRATGASNVSILLPISAVTLLPDSLAAKITGLGVNGQLGRWTGTNSMAGSDFTQSSERMTLAAGKVFRVTGMATGSFSAGSAGDFGYDSSINWFRMHNGTAYFSPVRSATTNGLGTSTHNAYYNSSGLLAGSANWTFDPTNFRILLTGTASGNTTGASFQITGSGSSGLPSALKASLLAGYTGSGSNFGVYAQNQTAGTSTDEFSNAAAASYGEYIVASNTGAGVYSGLSGYASGGIRNYGFFGRAIIARNSATNIGGGGYARNSGTSGINIGGIFALATTLPTMESAGLIADNGNTTDPIFLARDNNTKVFSIMDGGRVHIGGSNPQRALHVTGEVRITDLDTDTPTRIGMADADGDMSAKAPGFGLALAADGTPHVDTTKIATQTDLAAGLAGNNGIISALPLADVVINTYNDLIVEVDGNNFTQINRESLEIATEDNNCYISHSQINIYDLPDDRRVIIAAGGITYTSSGLSDLGIISDAGIDVQTADDVNLNVNSGDSDLNIDAAIVALTGDLTAGNISAGAGLDVIGATTLRGAAGAAGSASFYEPVVNGINTHTLVAGPMAADMTTTLPTSAPSTENGVWERDAGGTTILRATAHSSIAGSTDGSGDITVAHDNDDGTFNVVVQVTGTTFFHAQVHSKTGSDFKIRFYDAAGAVVTTTSVSADYTLTDI